MSTEQPIILRRLKTRDGIVSDIQELPEYRHKELRAVKNNLCVSFNEALPIGAPHTFEAREYVERKRQTAILIEMEEI